MTQEEKELLLKDLCSRLPYRVKGCADHGAFKGIVTLRNINIDNDSQPIACYNDYGSLHVKVSEFKPYLFPLSSMTEEQFNELKSYVDLKYEHNTLELVEWDSNYKTLEFWLEEIPSYHVIKVFDWLNKNHFDYRNLIPKGLAKDATGLNIY